MTRHTLLTLASIVTLLSGAPLLARQSPTPPPPAHPSPAQPPPVSQADFDSAIDAGPQGTLAIRAVQGTKGAPEVGVAEVEVALYHRDQVIWQIKSALDEHGMVVIDKIPVLLNVRPVVRVKYSGVLYQDVAPPMDAQHREASVNVTVYQTTDETPPWHVSMRHVVATRADNAFSIAETVVVENPADQTWLGAPADTQGRRGTVILTLPENAADIHLESGFHGWCCTAFSNRDLSIQMPLMPGKATYRFSYRVPVSAGRVSLCIGSRAPIDHAMFMVPDDASSAEPVLAVPGGSEAVGQARVRVYKATAVPQGQDAGIILTGLVTSGDLAVAASAASNTKTVAAIIAASVLIVGVGIVFLRSARRTNAA